jgi:hypothetical protein
MSYQQTVQDFRNAIFDLIEEVLGHSRVFPARTNFVKPKLDYVTYRIANMTPYERAGYLPDDGPEINISYLVYEVIVDIESLDPQENAISGVAQANCARIRHGFDMREIHYKHLDLNNIGYLRSSTISDTSAVLDGEQWEQRAAFTSIFSIIVKQSDVLGTTGAIEEVQITENIDADGNIIVQTDTIKLNP